VVRRHPDIKWLRRETDASEFGRTQAELLEALWRVLAPDGRLLYATCSVFPEENGAQVDNFLLQHPEAEILPLPGLAEGDEEAPRPFECQILPSADSDGFFYALLKKTAAQAQE
jgi:16S rRNA (cytosine967-C5)-methyltransferase